MAKAGDVLGRYELIEEIGEGGMATVFRARDRELRRDVAVKVLFPHLARRAETVRRFQREARAAAALEHPNILRIYDVGEVEDAPYIVMELIRGRTLLAEIEQRGAMLAEVAACIGALLADALGAAHQAGVIHRDVKPANVLVAGDGRVLLADFGVARLETQDSLVTRSGALLGTPAYMSPEQASGDVATARSDLYSLGATLYQLATGALPYAGTPAKVMSQIALGQLIAPVKRRAAVGPELSHAIEHAMAADIEARPASASEVAARLRAIASEGGVGDPKQEVAAYFADADAFVRAHTPAIVTAVIASAERALAERKLPRALALADRASALAPEDPRAKALVERAIAGGRASRRRKAVVAACALAAVAGGGTLVFVAGAQRGGADAGSASGSGSASATGSAAAAAAAAATATAAGSATAAAAATAAGSATATAAGSATAAAADAGAAAGADAAAAADAGAGAAADAGAAAAVRIRTPHPDAAADAAAAADAVPVPDAAPSPPARATLAIDSDAWCDVSIDHVPTRRRAGGTFPVDAGHHVVTCEQAGTGRSWSRDTDAAPGATLHVRGTLLAQLAVSFAIDAALDGVSHHRGDTVQVTPGSHKLAAGGTEVWRDFRVACTVRASPELDCYD